MPKIVGSDKESGLDSRWSSLQLHQSRHLFRLNLPHTDKQARGEIIHQEEIMRLKGMGISFALPLAEPFQIENQLRPHGIHPHVLSLG
jgi:hypothetical protein